MCDFAAIVCVARLSDRPRVGFFGFVFVFLSRKVLVVEYRIVLLLLLLLLLLLCCCKKSLKHKISLSCFNRLTASLAVAVSYVL